MEKARINVRAFFASGLHPGLHTKWLGRMAAASTLIHGRLNGVSRQE